MTLARSQEQGLATSPLPGPLSPEGDPRAWLRSLHDSLWREHKDPGSHNHIARSGWVDEARRMTPEEWETVQRVLTDEQGLVCQLHNACWGFGCGLTVYVEPPRIFPGLDEKPEFLFSVTKDHLPLEGRTREVKVLGKKKPKVVPADRTTFEDGWVEFSPFTHSEKNAKLLAEYGMEPPKAKGYYDY